MSERPVLYLSAAHAARAALLIEAAARLLPVSEPFPSDQELLERIGRTLAAGGIIRVQPER